MKKTSKMSAEELADIIANKLSQHLKSVELLSKDDSDGYPLKLLNYLSNGFDDLGEKEIENICELFYHKLRNSIVLEEYASLKQSEWISVEDELPEKVGKYLVHRTACSKTHFANWNGTMFAYNPDVTHWQPLPEPPNNKQ